MYDLSPSVWIYRGFQSAGQFFPVMGFTGAVFIGRAVPF